MSATTSLLDKFKLEYEYQESVEEFNELKKAIKKLRKKR